MSAHLNRRRFLRTAALGGTSVLLLKSAASVRTAQANDKLDIALVGVGGRGEWFTGAIPRMGQNLVALCDVDETKNPDAYERLPRARKFRDFRRLLEEMGASIDAVIVATPDHTHAVVSAAALRAGKPVFCEKPLTRTLHESRALRKLARDKKVATSMGNQGTAAGPFRRALELVRDGTLGEIKEVHVWNDSGGADRKQPPDKTEPVPDYLDWDLWLGPAAFRPYNREWMSRHLWREFGTSQLGNWASHTANLAFMALKVHDLWLNPAAAPKGCALQVEARVSSVNSLSFPRWEVIEWSIPPRAEFPPIKVTWHNGRAPGSRELLERLVDDGLDWGDKKQKKWADFAGAVIVGTKGSIHTTGHNATFRLLPAEKFRGVQTERPEKVEASQGHEMDWLRACRGGPAAWANFDYADALNEFLMLGNVATQFEGKLEFDPAALKVTNNSAADALLRCEYRKGWRI
ncbi:MAG TPA: Gfo/Idh/MocA family oxidoreductase [Verrucomicrobiae bacterium]